MARPKAKPKRAPKISIAKLANKQRNKLAKQGKLKTKSKKSKKVQTTSQVSQVATPIADESSDHQDILSDEDIDFYSSTFNRAFAKNVISTGEDEKKPGKKRHKENDTAYEDTPRATFNGLQQGQKKMKMMLPIKSHGKLIPQMVAEDQIEDDSGLELDESKELREIVPDTVLKMSSADLLKVRDTKMMEKKHSISRLAHLILENPQENVGKLSDLGEMLHAPDADVFITVKKLTMVTMMEVFKDVLPDYKIRLLTDDEQKQSMKKVTKSLVDYERSLLNNYRQYLEFLEKTAKGRINSLKEEKTNSVTIVNDPDIIQSISFLAVKCLCVMLTSHPNFNYCNNIVAVLIPKMMELDEKVSDTICDAVKHIFRTDKKGFLSLEIIKIMGDTLKRKNFNVEPKALNTCLSLNIREIDMSTAAERREEKRKKKLVADKMSRKDKRLNKRKAILEKEMIETRATEDKEKTLKMHTDVIKSLFLSYFRILKNASHSILMPAVLEGLAKFAHLINVEFFDDLFSVFNKLIQSDRLKYRELLHCVQTAFTILTGQGSVINVDPIQFYRHFYNNLFHIHAGKSSVDVSIVLGCLDIMVQQRKRQVSIQRVLAFIKRVCTMSVQQLPHGAIALLSAARAFIRTYPRSELLYDSETQGSGVYLPELEDPEYCNPQNTTLWELPILFKHYNKDVSTLAHHLGLQAPSTGQGQLPANIALKKPIELFSLFDQSDQVFDDRIPSTVSTTKRQRRPKLRGNWLQEDLRVEFEQILQKVPNKVRFVQAHHR